MLKQINYIFNRKEKVKLFFLLIMVVIGSGLELLGVTIFMPFIQIFMTPSAIQENEYLKLTYDLFQFTSTESFLTALTALIIFIYIFKNLFIAIEKNCIYKFSYGMQRKMSTQLLTAYMREPYTFHLNKNIAVLQRSLQEDTDIFTKGIIHALELVVEIAVCTVLGVYLFLVSQSITAIVIVLLIVCMITFISISKKFSKSLGKECQEYKGKLYQWMNQSIGGIKEVKILNREEYFITSYEEYFKKYVHGLRIHRLIAVLPRYFVEAICMTGLLLAIIVKMNFGQTDITAYIPQLAVFAVAAFRLLPSVGKVNEHVTNILYALPSLELIYHDLKEIEDVPEQNDEVNLNWRFQNEIKVKNVDYHYPDSEEMVIKRASFTVKKGETIAFIGSSGAGKSTIVDIILGLLQPQYGKVYADDMNIHKHLNTWHQELGYIPQVIYLSDDTIRNNIAFGIKESEINEDAVCEALRKAQLYEFVDNLPNGLDTFVGDRGVRLSGGQRQRIGIARALYHDPEVLVLDEATSALDNETETAVMESIEKLKGTKTMLIIAHRLTTIRNVDVIYEVTDGKILKKSKKEVFDE